MTHLYYGFRGSRIPFTAEFCDPKQISKKHNTQKEILFSLYYMNCETLCNLTYSWLICTN